MKKSILTSIFLIGLFTGFSQVERLESYRLQAQAEGKSVLYLPNAENGKVIKFKTYDMVTSSNGENKFRFNEAEYLGSVGERINMPGPIWQSWNGFASTSLVSGGPGETAQYYVSCSYDWSICLLFSIY